MTWLIEADSEEIALAILAVNPAKAAQIACYLVSRCGPEMAFRVDALVDEAREDPVRAAVQILGRVLR